MHDALLQQTVSTMHSWPLSGQERMAGEGAAATLLRAEAGGAFGSASLEDRERLKSVLTSTPGFGQDGDVEDAVTGGRWRPWGQTPHFSRHEGRTAAESVHLAAELLWSDADEAVFRFRRGDDLGAGESLRRALHALQDSFSPAHVKRVRSEDGVWVIKDVFESTSPDFAEHQTGHEKDNAGEAGPASLSGLGESTILACQLLLSYFVQRVLGLASEACQTREALERTFLREEAS